MDYLIALLCIFAWIEGTVVADEAIFRWERRNLSRADRFHVSKPEPPEYIDEDELFVISNDTDGIVFEGTPGAVYDWLQIYQGMASLDVFNRGTAKTVRASYFKAKYIEEGHHGHHLRGQLR